MGLSVSLSTSFIKHTTDIMEELSVSSSTNCDLNEMIEQDLDIRASGNITITDFNEEIDAKAKMICIDTQNISESMLTKYEQELSAKVKSSAKFTIGENIAVSKFVDKVSQNIISKTFISDSLVANLKEALEESMHLQAGGNVDISDIFEKINADVIAKAVNKEIVAVKNSNKDYADIDVDESSEASSTSFGIMFFIVVIVIGIIVVKFVI